MGFFLKVLFGGLEFDLYYYKGSIWNKIFFLLSNLFVDLFKRWREIYLLWYREKNFWLELEDLNFSLVFVFS